MALALPKNRFIERPYGPNYSIMDGRKRHGPKQEDAKMPVTRRTFLKASGAAGATIAVSSAIPPLLVPLLEEDGEQTVGLVSEEKWVPSVCANCPGTCGIVVRVVDGRAVKIEGNPKHPINQGRLCPKGQSGLQVLYDPDRIKGPMKRVGGRGSGEWEPISWDQAIAELAGTLRNLRAEGKAHTVVSLSGRRLGQMTALVENFMKAYGSPNHLRRGASCAVAGEKGYWMLDGQGHHRAHDWENANHILLFGYSMLEASRPLTYNARAYGTMRRGRPVRGKLTVVDPRMGTTGAKADEWIPIKPGTDGALALAIAHVILTEGLWDKQFVGAFKEAGGAFSAGATVAEEAFEEKETKGLVKWWNLVVKDATPAWQEEITGVAADVATRLAWELGRTKPSVVEGGDKGTSSQSNGVYTRACMHALNGLLGAAEAPGGILTQKSVKTKALPDPVLDEAAKAGYKNARIDQAKSKKWPLAGNVYGHVPDAIAEGYEVNVILGYYTNPYFCWPGTDRFREAFAKVPLLVSFSPFLDEYTANADLILPDHTYLERFQFQGGAESYGYGMLGLRHPVVNPLFDTMDSGDVFIRLARELGGTIAETLPFKDNNELIESVLSTLKPEERQALDSDGVIAKPPYKFRDYAEVFKTPSKKFEFDSGNLRETFSKLKMTDEDIAKLNISAQGDVVYLPHYEPIRYAGGSSDEYPLVLNTYKLAVRGEGRLANAPFASEILSPLHGIRWDSWVEIHPDTAKRLGIGDGESVWVESTISRVKTRARVFPGAEPGTVSIPHHYGHRGYGRWAEGRGVNPNDLIPADYDYLCGQAAFLTRVKVYSAGGEA